MDDTKARLYHILYADDLRLSSLDAQLHGKVPLSQTEDESLSQADQKEGGAEVPYILKASMGATTTETASQSIEYTFRDARYFSILEDLSIDLINPPSALSIQPDGEIHAFRGKVKAVNPDSYSQLSSNMEFQIELEQNILKGKMPGITVSADKSKIQKRQEELKKMQHLFKTGEKRLVASQFLLELDEDKTIYGPLNESFFRLHFIDLLMTFGVELPFEWIVVGYLYPYSTTLRTESEKKLEEKMRNTGLFGLAPSFSILRKSNSPISDAVMIPLLILR